MERLHVEFSASTGNLPRVNQQVIDGFSRVASAAQQASGKVVAFGGSSNAASGGISSLSTKLAGLTSVAGTVATGISVAVGAFAALAAPALKAASEVEQASVTFRTLTKDTALAAKTLDQLKAFAANTPFEFKDVREAGAGLLAYGFTAKELIPLLTNAGNAASAFGANIGDVTRALGRIKSGDFGEAFERFRDFGISRKDLEGQGLVFDKSGQYKGSVEAALTGVQNVIQNKFGGLMAEQSKTLAGQFSNLKDQAGMILADIGQVIVEAFDLKGAMGGIGSFLGEFRNVFQKALPYIKDFTTTAGNLWRSFSDLLAAYWEKASKVIVPVTEFLFNTLGTVFKSGAGILEGVFKTLTGILTLDWKKASEGLQNITVSIWNGIVSITASGINLVGKLFANFLSSVGADDLAKSVTSKLDSITAGAEKLKLKLRETSKAGGTLPEVKVTPAGTLSKAAGKVTGGGSTDTGSKESFKKYFDDATSMLKIYEQRVKEVDTQIENIIASGGQVPAKLRELRSGYSLLIDDLKKKAEELNNKLSGTGLGYDLLKGVSKKSTFTLIYEILATQKGQPGLPGVEQFNKRLPGMDAFSTDGMGSRSPNKNSSSYEGIKDQVFAAYTPSAAKAAMDRVDKILADKSLSPAQALDKIQAEVIDAGQALANATTNALKEAASSGIIGMAEFVGGLLSGANKLSELPNRITAIFADLAKSMGKSLIAFGTAGIAAKAFLSNPATALAAGFTLVALGSALSSTLQKQANSSYNKFANGGAISGPTWGLMGEYPGASTNKEFVGRFDQFSDAIAPIVTGAVAAAMPVSANYNSITARPIRTAPTMQRMQPSTISRQLVSVQGGEMRLSGTDVIIPLLTRLNDMQKEFTGRGLLS